jgi:hypothetical protein
MNLRHLKVVQKAHRLVVVAGQAFHRFQMFELWRQQHILTTIELSVILVKVDVVILFDISHDTLNLI